MMDYSSEGIIERPVATLAKESNALAEQILTYLSRINLKRI